MHAAKTYENVIRRFYRPEIHKCPECGRSLKRAVTISERTVVTLSGVIKLIHGGYRCLNQECGAKGRTYRSAAADALALLRMIFGLDVVILAGQLRLGEHRTLDEVHVQLSERLRSLGVSISRREIMNLFDGFSALLRAASDIKQDKEWLKEVEKNTGIIVELSQIVVMRRFTW